MTGVLVALGDDPCEPVVVARLTVAGGLRLERRCVDLTDLLSAAAGGAARAALVSTRLPDLDREAVARLGALGLVVVGVAGSDAESTQLGAVGVLRCVRVDPRDPESGSSAVALAVGDALADGVPAVGPGAFARATRSVVGGVRASRARPPDPAEPVPAPGRLVAVWGTAGAPGRTTVAVALADEAARLGRRALLIDADTYGASVATVLALPDDLPGVAACVRDAEVGRLDVAALARHAVALPGGPVVLTGLPRADRWPELRPAGVEVLYDLARRAADLVVVDVGPSLARDDEVWTDVLAPRRDAAALAAVDAADEVVVVGAADPLGLLRLVRALAELREARPEVVPQVVVTRVRASAVGADPERHVRQLLERHAGVTDAVLVPDDRPALDAAMLAGLTLAEHSPRSPARLALARWAAQVAGGPPATPGPSGATRGGRLRSAVRRRGGAPPRVGAQDSAGAGR